MRFGVDSYGTKKRSLQIEMKLGLHTRQVIPWKTGRLIIMKDTVPT